MRRSAQDEESEQAYWLNALRELIKQAGSRNQAAKLLGFGVPYIGRVAKGEKPITAELIERMRKQSHRP